MHHDGHFLGIASTPAGEIDRLLARAEQHACAPSGTHTLEGRTVCNLFLEDSTRTRTSFTAAARGLGAEVLDFNASASSLSKGESLVDTVETIAATGADCIVLRHRGSGAPAHIAARLPIPVVNAGDGAHAHPTQALLDALVMRRRLGTIAGKTVAIVGDILHSRVARSLCRIVQQQGGDVRFVGPRAFVPSSLATAFGVELHHDLRAGLDGADVAYALRIQTERQGRATYMTGSAYARSFGLNTANAEALRGCALIMHPGPFNRGVEIDSATVADERTAIIDQVAAGVHARMAVLERALTAGPWEGARS